MLRLKKDGNISDFKLPKDYGYKFDYEKINPLIGSFARHWALRAKDLISEEIFHPENNAHLSPYVNQVLAPLFTKLFDMFGFVFNH